MCLLAAHTVGRPKLPLRLSNITIVYRMIRHMPPNTLYVLWESQKLQKINMWYTVFLVKWLQVYFRWESRAFVASEIEIVLKGWTPFVRRGGEVAFFCGLNWAYLGFGVSGEVKNFFVTKVWPIGTHLGCGARRKVFAHIGTHPWNCWPRKMTEKSILDQSGKVLPDSPQIPSTVQFRSQSMN